MLEMCRRLGFHIRNDPHDADIKIVTLPIATITDPERLRA
jgi:acetyltransferase